MKIGFIGLGNMGIHMATRLLDAGHSLVVRDINEKVAAPLLKRGAEWATSGKDIASRVDTIFLSLPTPPIVEHIILGDDGLISGTSVRTIVDLSTTGPTVTGRVAAKLAERGIAMIDAPVSGGTIGAEAGTLAVMASGDRNAFDKVEAALRIIGSNMFYLGETPGQGQLMKVINNTMCAAASLATFEGLVLGAKGGLDAQTMLDVINVSSGRSFATEVKVPQCVINRNFPMRFSTDLLQKDVKLCLDEAQTMGVPMWFSQNVLQFLKFATTQGMGGVDYGNIIKLIEGWSGATFGAKPQ
jgi:3-hydroxyisobutyrate dehydrogenase